MKKKSQSFSFGLKLNFVQKKNVRNVIKLQNTEQGHSKFYTLEYMPPNSKDMNLHTIRCGYGKIGNSPQYKMHGFETEGEARAFMAKKLKSELRKGYKEI